MQGRQLLQHAALLGSTIAVAYQPGLLLSLRLKDSRSLEISIVSSGWAHQIPVMTKKAFLAQVVASVAKGRFPDYVKKSAADIAKEVSQGKEFFISGELVKGKPKTGASKVGGKPDVPAKFEWPHEEEDDTAPPAVHRADQFG